jgi:predicted nucleotidyltransferase
MRDERNLIAVTFTDPSDPLREVDVLVAPPLDAREMFERSIIVDVDGTTVRIASIDDLIAMKRATGRPHDADDVAHLERLRKRQDR